MRTSFITLFFVSLAACGPSLEQPESKVARAEDALINAPEDTNHTFAVGICTGEIKADGSCSGARCSGTLVAPNLVLTARHCVYDIDWTDPAAFCTNDFSTTRKLAETTFVTAGRSTSNPGSTWRGVQDVIVEPTANVCRDDIAYLVLDGPMTGVRPARVSMRPLNWSAPREVAVVGRGVVHERYDMTDFSIVEENDGNLDRRILEHIPFRCVSNVDETCREVDYFSTGNEYRMLKETMSFGASVLSGDSGAGVFDQAQFGRRQYEVLGVAVTATIGADGLPTASQATRLDLHRSLTWRGFIAAARATHAHCAH